MPKSKYYVVWRGRKRGIFSSWTECETQVRGFVGAQYMAFGSALEARAALATGYEHFRRRPASQGRWRLASSKPRLPSLAVDAACSGSPGRLEYRGVNTETGRLAFKAGPFEDGTNNVGEFLAIVDALRWLERHSHAWPVYSDSETAITWVSKRKCNTKLERMPTNRLLFEMIGKAEHDLNGGSDLRVNHGALTRVLKWDTESWGENPADFGRK